MFGLDLHRGARGFSLPDRMQAILSRSGPAYINVFGPMLHRLTEIGWLQRKVLLYLFNPMDPDSWSPLPNLLGSWGNGIWSGGLTFTPGQGTSGNGQTTLLSINMTMAQIRTQGRAMGFTFLDSEFSMSWYVVSDNISPAFDSGFSSSGRGFAIRFRAGASATVTTSNPTNLTVGSFVSSAGLSTLSRIDDSSVQFVKNGVITNRTQPFVAEPTGLLQVYQVGIANQHSAQELALMAVGAPCAAALEIQAYAIMRDALLTFGALAPTAPTVVVSPPHTFGSGAMALVTNGAHFLAIAAPPTAANLAASPQTYAGFPLDHCAYKMPGAARENSLALRSGEYLPMDRCQGAVGVGKGSWSGPGGGLLCSDGQTGVVFYTTVQRAMAANLVKASWSNGLLPYSDPDHPHGKGYLDTLADWWPGIDLSVWHTKYLANPSDPIFTTNENTNSGILSHMAYYTAHVDAIFSNQGSGIRYAVDIIPLNLSRLCDELYPYFFLMDGERFDILTPASQTLFDQFIVDMADIIHCKLDPGSVPRRFMISGPTPGQGLSGARCGFTPANGNAKMAYIDNMFIGLHEPSSDPTTELTNQITAYKGPDGTLPFPAGVGIIIGLGGPSEAQAWPQSHYAAQAAIRDSYSMWGYQTVPGGGIKGGAPSRNINLGIATLAGLPQNEYVG